jgi:histidyl-tRNA synthetase
MREIKETTYKGTRILLGNKKRIIINNMINTLVSDRFNEIMIPIIQFQELYKNKVGEENSMMMYNFKDLGDRDLCLAPEYTAVIQQLSKTTFKQEKDVKVFYIQECFRGERPQFLRYRQFTQLGVEIINPTKDYTDYLIEIAKVLLPKQGIICNVEATRGLDYYKDGKGFEFSCDELGGSKQICGGGSYDGGIGFAIGIDRILNLY